MMLVSELMPTPVRASVSDDPAEILRFALKANTEGRVALATLTEIRGGAARALGSHVAVAWDGRFCGYVSGGCVEAAVASEALSAIADGRDREVRYGEGSSFFDIALPCGGGITISIHVLRDPDPLRVALGKLQRRQPAALAYLPDLQTLHPTDARAKSGWCGGAFVSVYRPPMRVAVSGNGAESATVHRLAQSCGYETIDLSMGAVDPSLIDVFTAVVLLHHDLDAEQAVLEKSLLSPAFYIGALGSTRTHRRRVERLETAGFSKELIDRIKAPIGSFGPARDATSLALSVLSDVAASRLMVQG